MASSNSSTGSHITAGFISGLTSSVLLQPLDLLKTRIQQNQASTLRSSISELQGIADAWKGTVPSMLRTSVGGALYFTSLNYIRSSLAVWKSQDSKNASSTLPKLNMWQNLGAGAFARSAVGFITMPITVVKVRIESSRYSSYNMFATVRSVFQETGFTGFFKGYGVTVARDAPYAGLYVLFYEKNKELLGIFSGLGENQANTGRSAAINSASAVLAATLATTITGPFDTIKTRIQLDPVKYSNFSRAFSLIIAEGGFIKLFDGLSLRLTRKAFSSGIGWMIYEDLVRRYQKQRI